MKKSFVVVISFIMLCLSSLVFASCGLDDVYTVKFDADGGTLSFYSESLKLGDQIELPEGSKDGCKLACFIYEYSGKKTLFTEGVFLYRTDVTVKAIWAPENSYLIKYELNGSTLSGDVPFYYDGSEDVSLPHPQKYYEYFTGYITAEGQEPVRDVVIRAGESGDKVYYAQFTTKTYTVNLVLTTTAPSPVQEGFIGTVKCLYHGNEEQSFTVSYGTGLSLEDAVPVSSNYEFVSWKYYDINDNYVEFVPQGKSGAIVFNEQNFGERTEISVYVFCVGRNSPFI